MARAIQPGLTEFLRACKVRGLRLGVLSDYPAEAKLRALGVAELFDGQILRLAEKSLEYRHYLDFVVGRQTERGKEGCSGHPRINRGAGDWDISGRYDLGGAA